MSEKTNKNSEGLDELNFEIIEKIAEESSKLINQPELKIKSKDYNNKIKNIAKLCKDMDTEVLKYLFGDQASKDSIEKTLDKFVQDGRAKNNKENNIENTPKLPPKTRIKNFVSNITESLDKRISSIKHRIKSKAYDNILKETTAVTTLKKFATSTKDKLNSALGKNTKQTKKTSQRGI